jgi:hypothetical protein
LSGSDPARSAAAAFIPRVSCDSFAGSDQRAHSMPCAWRTGSFFYALDLAPSPLTFPAVLVLAGLFLPLYLRHFTAFRFLNWGENDRCVGFENPTSCRRFLCSFFPFLRRHISGSFPSSSGSGFPEGFFGTKDENGAGERNLVRLSVKFNASLYSADLRIGFNVIVPPRSVRAARQQHNDGGSSQGFLIRLLHPAFNSSPWGVAPAHLPTTILRQSVVVDSIICGALGVLRRGSNIDGEMNSATYWNAR